MSVRAFVLSCALPLAAAFHLGATVHQLSVQRASSPVMLWQDKGPGRTKLREVGRKANPFSTKSMTGSVQPTKKSVKSDEGEEDLMQKVKDAGVAGIISYIFWEWAFWGASVPIAVGSFYQLTGHWPDFQNQEDLAYLGGEAFAFVNVARFAVPLRIGLALGTTPWVQANIVDKFQKK